MTNKIALQWFNHFYIELQNNVDFTCIELSDLKGIVADLKDNTFISSISFDDINNKESGLSRSIEILTTCLSALDCDYNDLSYDEFFTNLEYIFNNISTDDFTIDDLPCGDVRLIHENEVDQIWSDELKQTIEECYDLSSISDLPSFIVVEIDWDTTINNAKIDGMGHCFAQYDGEAHYSSPFHIFRTN